MNKSSLLILLEVIFLVVFWAWAASAILFLRTTFLPRLPIRLIPEDLPAETVSFRATDGVPLKGWKLSTDPTHPWVIVCHGVGSNRSDLLGIAIDLYRAGFNLLLFDFRGHGTSGGLATSFGWQEQRDLEGALNFLGQQPDVPARPYGVYGISMGASVALLVAARDERIGSLAADSPYTNREESIRRHLAVMYPFLPRIPFLWFILATYRIRFGVWPRNVSPQESAAQVNPRPFLLIHGAKDRRMPLEGAQQIFDNAGNPKELWVIDEAGHLEGFSLCPEGYLSRLVGFFEKGLR